MANLVKIGDEMINKDWVIAVTKNKENQNCTDCTLLLPDGRMMIITVQESAYWVTKALTK